MENLFKRAAVFGDLHLGKRSDSPVHNKDCMDYIEWFCDNATRREVDHIIFVGDWFDNRSRIRLDTIDFGNKALRMLLEVAPVTMIVGNHDMFFRNNRTVHSLDAYRDWENVTIIDEPEVIGDVGLVPFLVGTEYLAVADMEAKYIFGHFELPHFLMNSTIEMPDKGGMNAEQFTHPELVFSGHFHKRQLKVTGNKVPVWYIGSPFGTDFNDVSDYDRGMMILDWGEEPEFIDWDQGPLYQRFKISEILTILEEEALGSHCRPSSILEIKDDMGLELEDITMLRDELSGQVREARIQQTAMTPGMDMETVDTDIDDKSLDEVVVDKLSQIDPHGSNIEPERLVKLFRGE